MPALEDAVAVGPAHLVALEHGLVVGQGHRLRLESHLLPGVEVLLLRGGRACAPPSAAPACKPAAFLPLGVLFQVAAAARCRCPSGPRRSLLSQSASCRAGGRAVAPLHPLSTVAHQKIDHIRGKTQIVVESQQYPHIRRGQPLAQLFLHLRRQRRNSSLRSSRSRHIGALDTPAARPPGPGRLQGGHQPQFPQRTLRRLDPQPVPPQLSRQRPGLHGAMVPEKGRYSSAASPSPLFQQPPDGLGGQRYALVLGMNQNAAHGSSSSRSSPSYSTRIFEARQVPAGKRRRNGVCEFFQNQRNFSGGGDRPMVYCTLR